MAVFEVTGVYRWSETLEVEAETEEEAIEQALNTLEEIFQEDIRAGHWGSEIEIEEVYEIG